MKRWLFTILQIPPKILDRIRHADKIAHVMQVPEWDHCINFQNRITQLAKAPSARRGFFCFQISREEIMKILQHIAFAFLVAAFTLLAATPAQAADGGFHVPFQEDQENWADAVCASMTEGGCLYFREHEAAAAWTILKEAGTLGLNVYFTERIVILDGGLELWRLELVLLMPDGFEALEVYATVESNSHLIDRVVMVGGRLVAGIGE
jgi:hypothetical protein